MVMLLVGMGWEAGWDNFVSRNKMDDTSTIVYRAQKINGRALDVTTERKENRQGERKKEIVGIVYIPQKGSRPN